jgi:hypothetical protein
VLNLLAIAALQTASFFSGPSFPVAAPVASHYTCLSIDGGTGGWTGDIAIDGGTGGWTGDIAAIDGGTGGWTGDIAIDGGTGGWTGDIA